LFCFSGSLLEWNLLQEELLTYIHTYLAWDLGETFDFRLWNWYLSQSVGASTDTYSSQFWELKSKIKTLQTWCLVWVPSCLRWSLPTASSHGAGMMEHMGPWQKGRVIFQTNWNDQITKQIVQSPHEVNLKYIWKKEK
jgi:hypothetical protein